MLAVSGPTDALRTWATDNVILQVVAGSHAYGLATETSDLDLRGVALPPRRWLVGFPASDAAQTAVVRAGNQDIAVHTLAKFCRLALAGNPNIIEMLFCRDEDVRLQTDAGARLRGMRDSVLSRLVRNTFVGYAVAQLKLVRNHNTRHGAHGGLIEQHGYDTKNAMHLVRLLRMGLEILRTGVVNVHRTDRDFLLGIRNGAVPCGDIERMAEAMIAECDAAIEHSPLPEKPDREAVERFLVDVQTRWVSGDWTVLGAV